MRLCYHIVSFIYDDTDGTDFYGKEKDIRMLNVVLYRPEIPPNTGSIARQCVGMNARLHIIGPIAFDLSESAVRRAGLDYWDRLNLVRHEDQNTFLDWLGGRAPWLITKSGTLRYDRAGFRDEDVILFGSETVGLPRQWRERWSERTVYIPMPGGIRSYNLANTAGIILAQASLAAGLFDGY